MATAYPDGIDEFTPITPGVPGGSRMSDIIGGRSHADIINDLQDGVVAIQTTLGTNPEFSTIVNIDGGQPSDGPSFVGDVDGGAP